MIDSDELNKIFFNSGLYMTKVEIENMIDKVDDNHNGSIDFEEFVELMYQKINT